MLALHSTDKDHLGSFTIEKKIYAHVKETQSKLVNYLGKFSELHEKRNFQPSKIIVLCPGLSSGSAFYELYKEDK
jgi:hypothetical protein